MVWQRPRSAEVETVAFTPNGKFIAAGGADNKVEIYDSVDGTVKAILPHTASVRSLRFSPNGEMLATGDSTGQLHLWRTTNWQEYSSTPHSSTDTQPIHQVEFSRDSKTLFSAGDNKQIRIWNIQKVYNGTSLELANLRPLRTLNDHTGAVTSVRISPNNRFLVSGGADGSGIRLYEWETGQLIAHLPGTGQATETATFTPDGKYILTGGNSSSATTPTGALRAYRLPAAGQTNLELVLTKPVFPQEYLDFSADGKLLVSAHDDGTLRLWKVALH